VDDYALILNAGSSSLKFCVFQRPDGQRWRLEARGQVEGIGTSPRLSAQDTHGRKLADEKLAAWVQSGRDAIDVLALWLRSHYGGSKVVGVGHRVVHWRREIHASGDCHQRGACGIARAGSARASASAV
jgi:acetate kinase